MSNTDKITDPVFLDYCLTRSYASFVLFKPYEMVRLCRLAGDIEWTDNWSEIESDENSKNKNFEMKSTEIRDLVYRARRRYEQPRPNTDKKKGRYRARRN